MQFKVKVIGIETIGKSGIHDVEAPEGSDVRQALYIVAQKLGLSTDIEKMAGGALLVNNKRVYADYVLQEGDYLQVLRTLEGG